MLDLAIDNRVFIYDIIDAAIQEIDLLFNTTNTELIGYTEGQLENYKKRNNMVELKMNASQAVANAIKD